jgi:hypothetical protein
MLLQYFQQQQRIAAAWAWLDEMPCFCCTLSLLTKN